MRWGVLALVAAAAAVAAGCARMETAHFQAHSGQEAIVRDGNPALVSRRPGSLVMVRPATRQFRAGRRVAYVVAVNNLTRGNLQLLVSNITVGQFRGGQLVRPLKVYTYEELVAEERKRQAWAAFATGLAAAGNAMSAANAGHYNANATVYSPSGVRNVSISGYDPTAAAIAQSNAAAQNDAMIAATIERGRQNLDALEQSVIKDNTLFPGEWYGGRLVFDPPDGDADKNYQITIQVGPDLHQIDISQERAGS